MLKITRRKFIKNTAIMSAGMMASQALLPPKHWAEGSEEKILRLLLVPPFLGKPTQTSISINIVAADKPISFYVRHRRKIGSEKKAWKRTREFSAGAFSPKEIMLQSLTPAKRYEYELYARLKDGDEHKLAAEETFQTQPSGSTSFSFAMFSDSHITPLHQDRARILNQIGSSILSRKPEFAFMLGDNIQTFTAHGGPITERRYGPILYASLRHAMGNLPSAVPVYKVVGNWEGENGWHPWKERSWAREARMAFIPTPGPDTYPEGGSKSGDYYGFTWRDTLFLALNVTGYTLPDHALQSQIGKHDDWTLGEEQKSWLYERLSKSKARWKMLFIHHTVGGNAGDDVNSRYGRGGGRAANTGEQAQIHQWMKRFGVQALFYGHDHVFTDIQVDGIHYVCVGSAGAPWKFDRTITGYEKYHTPSGYTWVDVHENKLRVSFIRPSVPNPEGEILHRFDIA